MDFSLVKKRATEANVWKVLFGMLLIGYGLYYAPYGINETDGGFLTGLAWQVQCGKTLYADVVYVRPPLPVWLRLLELKILPAQWAILGERWSFLLKIALYSFLGAAVLEQGKRRWRLAVFAFVVSVHCYPAASWHTVDGILFSVLSIWLWTNFSGRRAAILSGISIVAALLCKQSFYPMSAIWLALIALTPAAPESNKRRMITMASPRKALALLAVVLAAGAFAVYLYSAGLPGNFLRLTTGAASGGEALQHGILDYFRIQPVLLALSGVLLPVTWIARKKRPGLAFTFWIFWLLTLSGSYAWSIFTRQEFTVPFAQSRLLFWVAVGYGIVLFREKGWLDGLSIRFGALLALSWCASVSWGYNLPILFALPWVYAVIKISENRYAAAFSGQTTAWGSGIALLGLLALFRWGYEFVYRDGPRAAMTEHLGAIFPQLSGIYSSPETAGLYRDLQTLASRYGPRFKTLPAFPQANFLCGAYPPLPLDWIVARETGTGLLLVEQSMQAERPVFFIEKTWLPRIDKDPELRFTREILNKGRVLSETPFFLVVELEP